MDGERVMRGNILIVRHLPSSLDASEKENLLKHFGAVSVKCMANHGRMKHTAFANFENHNAASQALGRLHQMNVLGHTLTVQFAKTRRQIAIGTPSISDKYQPSIISNGEETEKKDGRSESISVEDMQTKRIMKTIGMAPDFGLSHPINPRLKYHYPPPTVSILSNIVNALASVPKFYVQTLHLMNKMSLPAPFGPLTPAPPLEDDQIVVPPEPEDNAPAEMEVSSSSEGSEMESDEESRELSKKRHLQLGHAAVKRPSKKKPAAQRKRPRLQDMIATAAAARSIPLTDTTPAVGGVTRKEVFDPTQVPKKPEIRLAESITSAVERQIQQGQISTVEDTPAPTNAPVTEEIGGFGTFQPPLKPSDAGEEDQEDEEEEEEEQEEEGPESAEFITREQLKKRLSKEEIKHISVFKNYTPGEPTTRLYVKNLAKQIEEKDLKFIFGRYVDWTSPLDKDMFNIQLMKQGRMKGQAFVGLPSELAAQRALRDTNGLLVHDKPIVVSFARSAKPKEKEDPKQKKKEAAKKPREARRI
eukprot:XP_783188.3 PREDICTED: RNA-binding protein 40 [Strongylocentrotus purpuratus]